MAKGRKAQGEAAAAAKGTRDRGAKAPETVALPPVTETVPAYLSADAKKVWARVVPHLATMNFFRATDHEALARYCENLKNWWACERALRRAKPTYETQSKHGKMLRVHPMLVAQNAYEKRLVALEDRIGLSPRARQEILRGLAAGPMAPPPLPFDQQGENQPSPARPTSPLGLLNPASDAVN